LDWWWWLRFLCGGGVGWKFCVAVVVFYSPAEIQQQLPRHELEVFFFLRVFFLLCILFLLVNLDSLFWCVMVTWWRLSW
jgi:hypothetical protein